MKTNKKLILSLASLFIIIGLIIVLLIVVQVPYTANVVYTEKEPYIQEVCESGTFKYSSEWVKHGWVYEAREMSPTIRLTNLENKAGIFYVQFAFFDRNYYEFEEEYAEWDNANIYSERKKVALGPYEEKEVNILTKNPASSSYWTYKRITAPSYEDCEEKTKYKDVGKTKTEIRYCNAWKKIIGKC